MLLPTTCGWFSREHRFDWAAAFAQEESVLVTRGGGVGQRVGGPTLTMESEKWKL